MSGYSIQLMSAAGLVYSAHCYHSRSFVQTTAIHATAMLSSWLLRSRKTQTRTSPRNMPLLICQQIGRSQFCPGRSSTQVHSSVFLQPDLLLDLWKH